MCATFLEPDWVAKITKKYNKLCVFQFTHWAIATAGVLLFLNFNKRIVLTVLVFTCIPALCNATVHQKKKKKKKKKYIKRFTQWS
jgi:hypothetical protein